MKQALIIIILCLLSIPAYAQEVVISTLCERLKPAEGAQSPEYVGGRDVKGNPVVPADLNQNITPIVYPIEIPIELHLLDLLDLGAPEQIQKSADMDTNVAYFKVFEDGHIEYNGQDISDRATHLCAEEKPPEEITPAAELPKPAAPVAPAAPGVQAAPTPEKPQVTTPEPQNQPAE